MILAPTAGPIPGVCQAETALLRYLTHANARLAWSLAAKIAALTFQHPPMGRCTQIFSRRPWLDSFSPRLSWLAGLAPSLHLVQRYKRCTLFSEIIERCIERRRLETMAPIPACRTDCSAYLSRLSWNARGVKEEEERRKRRCNGRQAGKQASASMHSLSSDVKRNRSCQEEMGMYGESEMRKMPFSLFHPSSYLAVTHTGSLSPLFYTITVVTILTTFDSRLPSRLR